MEEDKKIEELLERAEELQRKSENPNLTETDVLLLEQELSYIMEGMNKMLEKLSDND